MTFPLPHPNSLTYPGFQKFQNSVFGLHAYKLATTNKGSCTYCPSQVKGSFPPPRPFPSRTRGPMIYIYQNILLVSASNQQ